MYVIYFLLLCLTATLFASNTDYRISTEVNLGATQENRYFGSFRVNGDIALSDLLSARFTWAMTDYNETGEWESGDDPLMYDSYQHGFGHLLSGGISYQLNITQSLKLISAVTAGVRIVFSDSILNEEVSHYTFYYADLEINEELHYFFNDQFSIYLSGGVQGDFLISDNEPKEPIRDQLNSTDFGFHLGFGLSVSF